MKILLQNIAVWIFARLCRLQSFVQNIAPLFTTLHNFTQLKITLQDFQDCTLRHPGDRPIQLCRGRKITAFTSSANSIQKEGICLQKIFRAKKYTFGGFELNILRFLITSTFPCPVCVSLCERDTRLKKSTNQRQYSNLFCQTLSYSQVL